MIAHELMIEIDKYDARHSKHEWELFIKDILSIWRNDEENIPLWWKMRDPVVAPVGLQEIKKAPDSPKP